MKKKTVAIFSGLALASGVMAFIGIPGLYQIYMNTTAVNLEDISVCGSAECSTLELNTDNLDSFIRADEVTLSSDIELKPKTVIFANSIDLGGNTLIGNDELIVISQEILNGKIKVRRSVADSPEPLSGSSGGLLYISSGKLHQSAILDVSGDDGVDGVNGRNGAAGRRGRCDGFGKWRRAKSGGNGTPGGAGGDGGDAGEIFLVVSDALPLQSQINVAEGMGGNGGSGGQGGAGGRGCSGLGGSQSKVYPNK